MSVRRRTNYAVLARRAAQILFLVLFVVLIAVAHSGATSEPGPIIKTFFLIDPLVLVTTWLAAHAFPLAVFTVPAILLVVLVLAAVGRRITVPIILFAGLLIATAGMVASQIAGWYTVPVGLFWALATMLVTIVLGRVFCGWMCPLGTVHAIASRLMRRKGKPLAASPGTRAERWSSWSRWQLTKYYLLVAILVMAILGGHWGTIFDPLVLLYRTTTTTLFPAAQAGVEEGSTAVFNGQPDHGPFRPGVATEPVYKFLHEHVFTIPNQGFLGGGLILGLFLVTVALNAYRPRFWCRYLCPLGGMLGILSLRPLLRRTVQQEGCNQCDLCGRTCHGAAATGPGHGWMAAECLGCFHCSGACPRGALKFQWVLPWQGAVPIFAAAGGHTQENAQAAAKMGLSPLHRAGGPQPLDLSRRATLGAAIGGVAALLLARATPQARGKRFNPNLIRPPGARDERAFLARCTACGMCMKVCPTGGLQPCWTEAGLEGLWTPHLVPSIGHCDEKCVLCGHVCPTEAIRPLTVEEKKNTKIGLAVIDVRRCLPYAYGRDCMVCEEHCPVDGKAIYFVEVEVEDHDLQKTTIKQPRIDPDRCVGCGHCENVCVFKDSPAVRVVSANESRHDGNQPILPPDNSYGG